MIPNPAISLRKSSVQPTPFQSRAQTQPTSTPSMRRPNTAELLTHQVTGAGGLPVQTGLPPAQPMSIANRLHIAPVSYPGPRTVPGDPRITPPPGLRYPAPGATTASMARPADPGSLTSDGGGRFHLPEIHHDAPLPDGPGSDPTTNGGGPGGYGWNDDGTEITIPNPFDPNGPPIHIPGHGPSGGGGHGVMTPDGPRYPGDPDFPSDDGGGRTATQSGGDDSGRHATRKAGTSVTLPDTPTIDAPQSTLYNAATLGKQFLADYDAANAEAEQNAYRQAAQYNAAIGRVGSGMARDDINRVTRNIDADRLAFAYNAGNQERQYLSGRQDADRGYGLQRAGVGDQLANSDFMRQLQLAQFTRNGPEDTAATNGVLQSEQNATGAQTATGALLNAFALGQLPSPSNGYTPIPRTLTPAPSGTAQPSASRFGVFY